MSYKIVVDSCCELLEEDLQDREHFEVVPLSLEVGDYHILDDEHFDQKEFLEKVAESPECPKSACPSPLKFMEAFAGEAKHIFVVTLSSHLSGSYQSAMMAKQMYEEDHDDKQIHVVDSESASCGETQIVRMLKFLEEQRLTFEEIVDKIEKFRSSIMTYFVLDNLETLRKNGRLSAVKCLVANTLNIKPVMAGLKGTIVQKAQCIGMRKALNKMADEIVDQLQGIEDRVLMISHCNAPERAEQFKQLILKKARFVKVVILDTRGVSSMYANDGGIIVTV